MARMYQYSSQGFLHSVCQPCRGRVSIKLAPLGRQSCFMSGKVLPRLRVLGFELALRAATRQGPLIHPRSPQGPAAAGFCTLLRHLSCKLPLGSKIAGRKCAIPAPSSRASATTCPVAAVDRFCERSDLGQANLHAGKSAPNRRHERDTHRLSDISEDRSALAGCTRLIDGRHRIVRKIRTHQVSSSVDNYHRSKP
jgi:hypothetical protein